MGDVINVILVKSWPKQFYPVLIVSMLIRSPCDGGLDITMNEVDVSEEFLT